MNILNLYYFSGVIVAIGIIYRIFTVQSYNKKLIKIPNKIKFIIQYKDGKIIYKTLVYNDVSKLLYINLNETICYSIEDYIKLLAKEADVLKIDFILECHYNLDFMGNDC